MKIWSILVCLVALTGCSGNAGPAPVPPAPAVETEPAQEIQFARTGGGRFEFSMTKAEKGYAIRVTQDGSRKMDTPLALKSSLFSMDQCELIDNVFSGKEDLDAAKQGNEDSGLCTGTWANVQVKQGERLKAVTNESVISVMTSVETKVREQLGRSSPASLPKSLQP